MTAHAKAIEILATDGVSNDGDALSPQADISSTPNELAGPNFQFLPKEGSTNLVIYFSGTGKNNGRFDFWGAGRLVEENLLFVSDGRNFWYQAGVPGLGETTDETVGFIQNLCNEHGITKITTVGASMGGYGAILYAALLGGQALAFSFDSVLKLPTSPSEKHMPDDAPLHFPDIVPVVEETGTRVHIYAGEMYPMDLVGALRLAHLPTVTIDTLRGVDHSSARFVQQVAGLKKVIAAFIEGAPMPRFREAGTIISQPELVDLLHQAHRCFSEQDYAQCIAVGRKAIHLSPYNEAIHYLVGRSYLMRKKIPAATRHLAFVAAALPDFEDGQFYFAHALRVGRETRAAEDLFSRQLVKWNKSARVLYNLSKAQESIGALTEARASMKKAVAIERAYRPRFVDLLARIADLTETENRPLNEIPTKAAYRAPKTNLPKKPAKPKTPPKAKKPKTLYGRGRSIMRKVYKAITGQTGK